MDIAKALGRSYASITAIISHLRDELSHRTYEQNARIYGWPSAWPEEVLDESQLAEERREVAERFIGKPLDILFLSDIHVPFQHRQLLERILTVKADLVILGGDILDGYSVSKFRKTRDIPLARELAEGGLLVQRFAEQWPHVVLLQGNHDMRLFKLILDKFRESPEIGAMLKEASDLLERITEGLKNVTVMHGWWCRIGRAIFCHRESYRKIIGRSGEDGCDWFSELGEEFELMATGHLHRWAFQPYRRRWIIENPAACYRQDYTYQSTSPTLPFVVGYSVIKLDEKGRFLVNDSRPYFVNWT